MSDKPKYATREQWLEAAVELLRPIFKGKNHDIPPIKVSTGWPSKGGLAKAKRTLGQCWEKTASEDGETAQIFISPLLLHTWAVLSVLAHEVCHAVAGPQQGHGKKFKGIGKDIGLEGKAAHMVAGADLLERFKQWEADLGPYPHQKINPSLSGVKKQGTRMIKCVCGDCDYTVRTTQKWIDLGTPLCACNKKPMNVELPKEKEDDDE
jgi:hypothetical protein